MKQPPPVELTIGLAKETVKSKAPKDDPNPPAQITYKVKDTKDTDVLNVALVERGLKTKVLRGENRGRSLTHENVVRWFNTVKIHRTAQGRVTVPLPKDLNKSNASIIAYVQDSKTMLIRGADRVDMTQPKPAK